MKNNTSNLAPFFVGEKVVPTDKAVKDYRHLAKVWNLPYPDKDEVCVVLSIAPHPKHDFWLVRVQSTKTLFVYPQELCHRGFASIGRNFVAMTYKQVVEQEAPTVCQN